MHIGARMQLVDRVSTWSQEWEKAGPYMFACCSTCIDLEHGAKSFELPQYKVCNKHGEDNTNPNMAAA